MAEFKLPEVGEGITKGTVVNVLVKVGDTVAKDQPVIELETDKAVVEVPSSVAGVVQEVRVQANKEANIGDVILVVGEGTPAPAEAPKTEAPKPDEGKTPASKENELKSDAVTAAEQEPEPVSAKTVETPGPKTSTPQSTGKETPPSTTYTASTAKPAVGPSGERRLIPAAPSVRRLAREMGVSLQKVAGSGVLGRISANDVVRFANGGGGAVSTVTPAAVPQVTQQPLPDFSKWGEVERSAMNGIRKATVRSMTNAWSSVPMVTQFDKADITEFEAMRKKFQPRAEAVGAKITPTAMLLKIVASALKRFPDFNSSLDTANNEIIRKHYVNIGVAVDTENGLLVPVIKNADKKGIIELAKELGDLAAKARARKLTPDDMSGGNFSISNLGGIGGTGFTPIVNPPDVGILGVSRGSFEPVWNKDTNTFEPKMMMPLCVSYDHRLVDGAGAARFLRWICEAVEEPFLMMLE
jgi:pyruvate dehydrogenase E2 component (dihydrolipoamide acetyltransferase)